MQYGESTSWFTLGFSSWFTAFPDLFWLYKSVLSNGRLQQGPQLLVQAIASLFLLSFYCRLLILHPLILCGSPRNLRLPAGPDAISFYKPRVGGLGFVERILKRKIFSWRGRGDVWEVWSILTFTYNQKKESSTLWAIQLSPPSIFRTWRWGLNAPLCVRASGLTLAAN